VLEEVNRLGALVPVKVLGIPDLFIPHGKTDKLLADLGLDAKGIAASTMAAYSEVR
jgi:deoxyxylulose-5-phosphate synthase